jgi:cytochrome c-type biogenesis protein
MIESMNIALVFAAGLASVLSPCVLPVIPIIVTGKSDDHKLRPLFIIAGLALTFTIMGILSSLFGAAIGSKMHYVEKGAGVLITIFGVLHVFNVNMFKYLGFLSQFGRKSGGRLGGFLLGFTLGIIWIPCVGPMLSGVLALVAVKGEVLTGAIFLLIYSAGFAVPMLIAAYASQFFRNRFRKIGKYPQLVNIVSGGVLIAFGLFITFKGIVGFAF